MYFRGGSVSLKFNAGKAIIEMVDKVIKTILSMGLDDEDIIDEPLPDYRCWIFGIYICVLKPTHEGVGI